MPDHFAPLSQHCARAGWIAALLGLSLHGTSALASPEFCEPRGWAPPKEFPAGSDLTAADYAWTAQSTKQRASYDLRSVSSKHQMLAIQQAIHVVRFSFYALTSRRQSSAAQEQDDYDKRQVLYSTVDGHRRGMAFRDEYGRDMASTQCLHNWNLVSDDRLEVDVLRRPVRLAPWSDLIRMRFVRQGKDWKFDDAEWLNRRIEPADVAPK